MYVYSPKLRFWAFFIGIAFKTVSNAAKSIANAARLTGVLIKTSGIATKRVSAAT